MFDMQDVGRRIAALRKAADMTQMELADRLDISFQAVSNWERGNTMPDIAKLPELAELFDVSIDALLGKKNPLVEATAANALKEHLREGAVEAELLMEAAPLLKPTQMDEAAKELSDELTLEDVLGFAPFASEQVIDELIERCICNGMRVKERTMCMLLPFASAEMIDRMAWACMETDGMTDIENLRMLAPFISGKTMDALAAKIVENGETKKLCELVPFLGQKTVNELLRRAVVKPEAPIDGNAAKPEDWDHGEEHADEDEDDDPKASVHVHYHL